MRPPIKKIEYEKVPINTLVDAVIEEIIYDMEKVFKGFGKDENGKPKPDYTAPAVRFSFLIHGCKFLHKSKWLKFSTDERSNLYKNFIDTLVANSKPNMDFDLDALKGMKIKMLWREKGEYQEIVSILPAEGKINVTEHNKQDSANAEVSEAENDAIEPN